MTTLDKTDIELLREYLLKTWPSATKANALCDVALDALSSLPAQAVGVKALEWIQRNGLDGVWDAESVLGNYRLDDVFNYQTSAGLRTMLPSWRSPFHNTHEQAISLDEAKAAAQADYEARILSALVAPSQPAAVGERADALWEQLLPLMQVEECSPGDPYKDKVAALALIEAALVHRDQVKL